MRLKIIILIILVLVVNNLASQQLDLWQNICNSAAEVDSEMIVNVDVLPSVADSFTTEIFYSSDGAQNWYEEEMFEMEESGYQLTLTDSFMVTSEEDNFYGFRSFAATGLDTLSEQVYLSMAPRNLTNTFPAAENYLIPICPDSLGDAQAAPSDPFLDLLQFSGSFSEDKFYFQLTNNDTQWDTYGGMLPYLPPWYIYSIAIRNPESADSCLYAAVYAEVPEIPGAFPGLSPGLYKGNIIDTTFSQIGEIEHDVVNGKLQLAFNIEDLTNDPDFGQWPNISGSIFCGVAFITIGLDGIQPEIVVNDMSYPCFYFPQIMEVATGDTTSPELSELTYIPIGSSITFSIIYTDLSNNLPAERKLILGNGTEYNFTSADHVYNDGSLFTITISEDEIGSDPVFAEFSDGVHSVISNEVIVNEVDQAEFLSSNIKISPNPFTHSVKIAFQSSPNNFEFEDIRVGIFNIKGQRVRTFSPPRNNLGEYNLIWLGKNDQGIEVRSGIYFCKIMSEEKVDSVKKLLLVR